jgi:hypothetical protein
MDKDNFLLLEKQRVDKIVVLSYRTGQFFEVFPERAILDREY